MRLIDADDLIKAFEALDLMNGQYAESFSNMAGNRSMEIYSAIKQEHEIFECIDVMEEAIGTEDVKGFCLCNAFKYIYRCCKKNTSPLEDVKKAVWYLNKFIEIEEYTGIKVNEHESHM